MEGGFAEEFHWNISNGNEKLTPCAISECVTVHRQHYVTREPLQFSSLMNVEIQKKLTLKKLMVKCWRIHNSWSTNLSAGKGGIWNSDIDSQAPDHCSHVFFIRFG